jgi:hypothetical protein
MACNNVESSVAICMPNVVMWKENSWKKWKA